MANDLWRTPPEVFQYFNKDYNFICDVAASNENHLCTNYLTEKDNGLTSAWNYSVYASEYVWCNPPYSQPLPWVKKIIYESKTNGIGTVLLLNHDMTTKWASLLLSINCHIIVITGSRISFLNEFGVPTNGNSKGQVVFIIPPYVDTNRKPTTEYVNLSIIMADKNEKESL
tara:strand:- start:16679 stop:17191 length:513 start_codon:yes stop_codon:yes gene_type:complete